MPKERAEYAYVHHIIFRYIGYVIVQRPESKLNYKYEVVTIQQGFKETPAELLLLFLLEVTQTSLQGYNY